MMGITLLKINKDRFHLVGVLEQFHLLTISGKLWPGLASLYSLVLLQVYLVIFASFCIYNIFIWVNVDLGKAKA